MSFQEFDPDFIRELQRRIASKQAQLNSGPAEAGLVPLQLTCAMTACKHGRHCLDYLRRPHKGDSPVQPGQCRDCGTNVAELPALGGRRYGDVGELLETCSGQQSELIRAHYWHVQIDQWAYNQARRLGLREVRGRVEAAVTTAMTRNDMWAGRGAAYSQNIVAYAQHATATCCRRCAAYWHGLSPDSAVPPSQRQLDHVISAALSWVELRLTDVPLDAETNVSRILTSDLPSHDRVLELDDALFEALGNGRDPVGLLVPVGSSVEVTRRRSGLLVKRALPAAGLRSS
jgi:hypothetical protein